MKRSSLMFLSVLGAVAMALTFALHTGDVHAASGALAALSDPSAYAAIGFGMLGRTTIADLRDERNTVAKEVRDLLDKTPQDKWTEESTKLYDEKMGRIERIDATIGREQRLMDATAEKNFKDRGGREGSEALEIPGVQQASEGRRLFNKLLREGERGLNAEEWTTLRNTMSTTTGSEGGFTVQTDVAKTIIEALKFYGGMRMAGDVMVTATGAPLNFPTTDGTAEVGELIAENQSANDADASFGTASLNVFKYSSKVITVPLELLQDSSIDVEALIRARLVTRIGRITNQHFTTGTGTGQPRGIVTAAGVGKVGLTTQTASVIYDDLVDLQESVDPAYQANGAGKWMFNQSSRRVIRKIKDTTGRPIFNPGYEVGVPGGAPDQLLGSDIMLNQDMPAMAANAKSVLFGDFKYYKVRDAMAMQLFRFADSAYLKKGQIGFLAWMRCGGNFIDASGGAVKAYQNSAT